jgi:(S)-3,5-dihydroxyphenylglycine transaminase
MQWKKNRECGATCSCCIAAIRKCDWGVKTHVQSAALNNPAMTLELKECFTEPALDAMNFLNEIVLDYPDAISFAPGRPPEEYFDVENCFDAIGKFVHHVSGGSVAREQRIWQELGQYNRTNGIINELIARQLELDEGIHVSPASILVTVGAQEAMALVLIGLFDPARDVLLVSDPTYIGITGLARVLGIRILPVPSGEDGLVPEIVEEAIRSCFRTGRPRGLYDIPDFNNPLGTTLSLARRQALLDICHKYGVLLIEDNPYGMFRYDGERIPPMKALDQNGTVLYIGSFSKTVYPGTRLGYLVADQPLDGGAQTLARQLSKVKSFLTVNTSPLLQAVVGGILLANQGSLQSYVKPRVHAVRRNRDVMLESLAKHFGDLEKHVSWNHPQGGFFITLTLPFPFSEEELKLCAAQFGVIVCPMCYFAVSSGRECQVRLSFSYVNETQIRQGTERIAAFVEHRLSQNAGRVLIGKA